jgi:5-methylcytosine-specific restriction protein A
MRQEFPAKVKAAAALRANGSCEGCTRRLSAGDFHYDHEIPDALGGEPTLQNCRVLCRSCHKVKTTEADVPRIAKAKRNYRKAHGIKKRSSFQTNRDGPFRKRMDGTVERRHTGE